MADTKSYREQQSVLHETYAAIGKKTDLILTTGQLLMENGADTSQIVRDMTRAAAYMGIDEKQFNLHIMYTTLMLNISDETHAYTNFRKCRKHAVDMRIISAVSRLTWRALRDHYTLEEYEDNLKTIAARPKAFKEPFVIIATGCACGCFCGLFGCDLPAFFYTAICAMLGKIVQVYCHKSGVNAYMSMAIAAFVSTALAFFAHFLPSTTPWHPIIAATIYLVPGIPLINSISDMINGYLISGAARFMHTSLLLGGIAFGIVLAIEAVSVEEFTQLQMVPENDFLRFIVCAGFGAAGFSVLFNVPPRLLFASGLGGVIAVCTRNFCIFTLGWTSVTGTFIGATLVSIVALYAIHWLHAPTQVLTVPSVIPLVPGVLIYRLLFSIINIRTISSDQLISAIQAGVDAALIILCIAIGVAMPNIFANRRFERRKKEEQERLLKEAYETDE